MAKEWDLERERQDSSKEKGFSAAVGYSITHPTTTPATPKIDIV
jgi:hypothetical protein